MVEDHVGYSVSRSEDQSVDPMDIDGESVSGSSERAPNGVEDGSMQSEFAHASVSLSI